MDAKLKLPEGVTRVGPVVLVESAQGASHPRGIRMKLPDGVADTDRPPNPRPLLKWGWGYCR